MKWSTAEDMSQWGAGFDLFVYVGIVWRMTWDKSRCLLYTWRGGGAPVVKPRSGDVQQDKCNRIEKCK